MSKTDKKKEICEVAYMAFMLLKGMNFDGVDITSIVYDRTRRYECTKHFVMELKKNVPSECKHFFDKIYRKLDDIVYS